MKRIDIEAKLFMYIFRINELKDINYSVFECDNSIAYVFDNYEDFKKYFINNGCNVSDSVLSLCILKVTRKGSIIALKGLCDYVISRSKCNLDFHFNKENVKSYCK